MRLYSILALAALAAGCAQQPTNVEGNFGGALNRAKAAQVINPDAPSQRRAPAGTDGEAARLSVEQYEQSYSKPAAPASILNIGVGAGTTSSGK